MFCTFIRKRPEWAPVVPKLLESQIPKWTEQTLKTHDIVIQILAGNEQGKDIRMLLLSATDMKSPDNGWKRIEKLYHLTGGHNVGIVFLVGGEDATEGGVHDYMELQAKLLSAYMEMPIIPLSETDSLPVTIFTYQQQMLQPHAVFGHGNDPILTVLPFCTERPPMGEHTRDALSALFSNFRELAIAATTGDGQNLMRLSLGDPALMHAEGAIAFWLQEYLVD